MANVSSSNGLEKRPRLAFRNIDGSRFPCWRQTSLGCIIEPYSEKVYGEHDYEVLTSAREGLQRQVDHFGSKQRHDTDGYNIIPFGYCTYRNRSDDGKFAFNINTISEKAIVSKFYPVFRFTNANSTFMAEFLNSSPRVKKKLSVLAVGTSQVVLSFGALKAAKFDLPCKDEQDKIAAFLECLNTRIENQRTLVVALKKYKRGLSNSLFDRLSAGSESRLCIFGDMMTILQNNTFSRDNLSVGGNGVRNIHYGDVLIKYGAVLDLHSENVPVINAEQDISKFSALSYLRNGDVVFADTAEDYTVGKSTEIIGAENIAALSGLHTIPCRPQDSFAPMYLGYYFNSDYFKKQLYPMIQGTKVSSISKSEIIKTKIIVPCLQEQARIASIMSALDDRIDAAKHTTKDLIDLRSGLLQQLFI